MSIKYFRLLDTGVRDAAENMTLDDVLLESRARGLSPDTVRFLRFNPPAVLVGYHQSVEQEVRVEFCRGEGIEINRRLTGGGAIYFNRESLGWEIIASKSELNVHPTEKLFRHMCMGVIYGLRRLGIQAEFRPKNDIEVDGRKISGTGGTERDDAFLFQGTLLLDFDVETMIRALRIPVIKLRDKEVESVRQRVTCVKWELRELPSLGKIKEALREGFEKAFSTKLVEGELTNEELRLLRERISRFRSKDWVFMVRRPPEMTATISAIDKTPGGLIRVALTLDRHLKVIRNILITGDFFAFPSRAILDLEACLKGATCNKESISKIIHDFFRKNKVYIPGVTAENLIKVILKALEKIEYSRILGVKIEDTNYVYMVGGSLQEVLKNGIDALLLPYCAKLPKCEYRKRSGCVKCGGCSVGQAYTLAEETGLKPITIQNFEHLMCTLEELKRDGAQGYIGCCCEGFYCKHKVELEETGLPGILIDIDDQTCYDLGMETKALRGDFENQTELKMRLLKQVILKIQTGKVKCGHIMTL